MEAELRIAKLREKHLYKQARAMLDLLHSLAIQSKLNNNLVQQLSIRQEQMEIVKNQSKISGSTVRLLRGDTA